MATDPLATIALLGWFGEHAGLVVALFAAHTIADFVLQTRAMVDAKSGPRDRRLEALLKHGAVVAFTHAAWLLPFGLTAVALSVPLAGIHVVIDVMKPALERRFGPMRAFFIDQFAHVVTLLGCWACVTGPFREILDVPPLRVAWPDGGLNFIYAGVILSAFAFVVHGAGAIVQFTLAALSPPPKSSESTEAGDDDDDAAHRGAVIGILERLMVLGLVLVNQWAAIGLIITAKSVARFKRIEEDQAFGETYLIGTLTSVLLAVAAGIAVRLAI